MMKKFQKFVITFVICIVLILSYIFFSDKIYTKKIEKIYYSRIKEELNTDTAFKIKSIRKYEDKTKNISYKLELGEIDGFDINVQISNVEDILKPNEDTTINVNIDNLEIAQILYDKYGVKYKVTKIKSMRLYR